MCLSFAWRVEETESVRATSAAGSPPPSGQVHSALQADTTTRNPSSAPKNILLLKRSKKLNLTKFIKVVTFIYDTIRKYLFGANSVDNIFYKLNQI